MFSFSQNEVEWNKAGWFCPQSASFVSSLLIPDMATGIPLSEFSFGWYIIFCWGHTTRRVFDRYASSNKKGQRTHNEEICNFGWRFEWPPTDRNIYCHKITPVSNQCKQVQSRNKTSNSSCCAYAHSHVRIWR